MRCPPGPDTAPGHLVVTADRLFDGLGTVVERPALSIIDGRVVAVETRGPSWQPPTGWSLIDERAATILPGLVDAHLHLAFPDWTPRAVAAEREDHDPSHGTDPLGAAAGDFERAAANAVATLLGGVTTVRDLGSRGAVGLTIRDAIARGERAGPRTVTAGLPITVSGGHCHWFAFRADGRDALLAAVRRLADDGVDWIKVMVTGGSSTPGSQPLRPQFTADELRPAVEEAHRRGLRVAAHALSTAGVKIALAAAVDTLEHGWTITGGVQDFEPSIAREVADTGVFASVTAHHLLRALVGDPPDTRSTDRETLRRRLIPHRALAAAGVPMVVHSDAGPGPTRYDAFADSIRAFAVGMDVAPVDAIAAATSVAARSLGLDADVGSLGVGRLADVIVVDGDPLTDLDALRHVRRVLLGGRTVVQSGASSDDDRPD